MLKAIIDKKEDIPSGLESYYTEKDGKFILAVDGMVDKGKLDEFRSNNIDLLKQIEEMNKKYEGLDISALLEAMKKQTDDHAAQLLKDGKVDELIKLKLDEQQKTHAADYKKVEDANAVLTRQLESLTIDNAVRTLATEQGVAPTAMDDVVMRAKQVYKLVDGKPTPHDTSGNIIYAQGSTDPLGMNDWVKGLSESAPHLFNPSNGGGSQHGNGGAGGEKTMKRTDFDALDHGGRAAFFKDGGKIVD